MPDINWATLSGSSDLSSKLCDLFFQHNYVQQVDHPTHIHGNVLDLIITSSENTVSGINFTQEFNQAIKSGYLISFKLQLTSLSPTICKDPVYYHKGDYEGLNDLLYNTDFSRCYQSSDVEFIWSFITSTIMQCYKGIYSIYQTKCQLPPQILHSINTTSGKLYLIA